MLDEPTNDLDTDTLAAVEDVLDGWPGTLVVVSHDRYLLERVTDHQLALLGDGTVRALPGGVEQYLKLREEALAAAVPAGDSAGDGGPAAQAATQAANQTATQAKALGSGASEAEKRQARKELGRVERQLGKIADQEAKLHEQMAEAAEDYPRLAGLNEQLQALLNEKEELELAWLEASEVLE
jgi:ATPase subunit of ABC transporter with duplicated ATPase domains